MVLDTCETMASLLRRIVLLIVVLIAHPSLAASSGRVALVVGVSAYQNAPPLPNTVNDARAVSQALSRLGFSVQTVTDPDRSTLEKAVRAFGDSARQAEAALFYYAGHAIEVGGRNWLLPVTTKLTSARDLRFEALDFETLLDQTDDASRVSLLFLDACRNNPFLDRLGSGGRDLPRNGLSPMQAAVGTLVAFSTAPGKVAEDGRGANSPFTTALLKHIETPGLEVRQLLSLVRREVRETTRGAQVPWENSALEGEFFFRPAQGPSPPGIRSRPPDAASAPSAPLPTTPGRITTSAPPSPSGSTDTVKDRVEAWFLARVQQDGPQLPQSDARERVRRYLASGGHKAYAISRIATVRSYDEPSTDIAERNALERCQVAGGVACSLVLVDDALQSGPPRPSSRVDYAGVFDPERVPGLSVEATRTLVRRDYPSARGQKAIALHPFGVFDVVSGAADRRSAESEALAGCNKGSASLPGNLPCYLYASGNQVVLPQRRTSPLEASPASSTGQSAATPSLEASLGRLIASRGGESRFAALYVNEPAAKAMAMHVESGRTIRFYEVQPPAYADTMALEACQIAYGAPCALLASNNALVATSLTETTPRSMPNVTYAGRYTADRVPVARLDQVRSRRDYAMNSGTPAKAMAIHPVRGVNWAGGSTRQEAQTKALDACNRPNDAYACLVYAVDDTVVLPSRSSRPLL